ncbi:hypothetical protein QOZ80_3BG0291830 [Eleusine coracana subsp. coracana]|nr:hypothetical protein QOZ80_3BG0291830 [Eleusine coracana subsp. coracana]
MVDTVHLVLGDDDGLLLVHRKIREVRDAEDCYRRKYKVYKVDLDAGKVTTTSVPTDALGGRTVFIGLYRALCVSNRVFPFLRADTVYPGWNCDERTGHEQIGAYRPADGSVEPANYDMERGLARPWTIADFLAVYVSG